MQYVLVTRYRAWATVGTESQCKWTELGVSSGHNHLPAWRVSGHRFRVFVNLKKKIVDKHLLVIWNDYNDKSLDMKISFLLLFSGEMLWVIWFWTRKSWV